MKIRLNFKGVLLILLLQTCFISYSFSQKSTSDFVFSIYTGNPGYTAGYNYYLYLDTLYTYKIDVDWENDGIFDDTAVTSSIFHQYSSLDTFQIRIRGKYPRMFLGKVTRGTGFYLSDHNKVTSVDQWGDQKWEYVEGAFRSCEYLVSLPLDTPDFSNIRSLSGMFLGASSMNGQLNHWQVDSIQNTSGMFNGAKVFNQPLDQWNVSSVKYMAEMFSQTDSFNQALNSWDMSSVENIHHMFSFAKSFNQPLDQWEFPALNSLSSLFRYAERFNQPLDSWDVSNINNLFGLFDHAIAFNQPLNSWNVANVQSMGSMFYYAISFNQPLNNWNLSSALVLSEMFAGAEAFDQPLNTWDVSSVTNMRFMFSAAKKFNQPLNNWDISNVINMSGMFDQASRFNQPLHYWDYSSVSGDLSYFLDSSGLSVLHYDSLLFHFNHNPFGSRHVLGARNLNYCDADSVRSLLINKNWRIEGDSLNCSVGLKEHLSNIQQILVYPNPSSDRVNISFDSNLIGQKLQLLTIQGQLVEESLTKQNSIQLNLNNLGNGVYVLRIGNYSHKLIVNH